MLVKIACIQQDAFALTEYPGFIGCTSNVAIVAQLVRAPACGAGGRRFESGLSPHLNL